MYEEVSLFNPHFQRSLTFTHESVDMNYISVLFCHLICLSCFGSEVMLTSRTFSPICVLHNLPQLFASACNWYPWAAWAWGDVLLQRALTQVQLPQDLWIGFLCNILLCDGYICHFSFRLLWLFNCSYIHILQSFLIAWSNLWKCFLNCFQAQLQLFSTIFAKRCSGNLIGCSLYFAACSDVVESSSHYRKADKLLVQCLGFQWRYTVVWCQLLSLFSGHCRMCARGCTYAN